MSGKKSRDKGARGERELFNLLNEKLGGEYFKRNLEQTRSGGADAATQFPVAIEVKRREKLNITTWLKQAQAQANDGEIPAVAYRPNRGEWHILIDLSVERFVDYLRTMHDL